MNNILRQSLVDVELRPYYTFSEEWNAIETRAMSEWVPMLGEDKGSHNGLNHLSGIENQIVSILNRVDIQLTPVENFILLSSILFHDLGKLLKEEDLGKQLKEEDAGNAPQPSNQSLYEHIVGIKSSGDGHPTRSAQIILQKRHELGFSDKGIARCVATVCAAHDTNIAQNFRKKGYLNDYFLDNFGRIRIGWLAALLALGDELDNSYHRAVPDFLLTRISKRQNRKSSKGDLRVQLAGCEIDLLGQLLIVHPLSDFKKIISSKFVHKNDYDLCQRVANDIVIKKNLIELWRYELSQMNLELLDVAISVRGHLLTTKENHLCLSPPNHDVQTNAEFRPQDLFRITIEPSINHMKLERVLSAAIQLRINSFGKTRFPWEALATEAGIEKLEEARLIFHRLGMLAQFYFEPSENELKYNLKLNSDTYHSAEIPSIKFEELDDEWSIVINGKSPHNFIEKSIPQYYKWVSSVIFSSNKPESQRNDPSENDDVHIHITNEELGYLLDESNGTGGIILPGSKSILHSQIKRANTLGINMVITGPTGIGKSTLAMEILAGSKVNGHSLIGAYYSIEQPIETICKLAIDLGITKNNIHQILLQSDKNQPDDGTLEILSQIYTAPPQKSTDPILLLPKLAPRSYNQKIDEDSLFWFRYKQIARLCEANLSTGYNNKNNPRFLSPVIIDNLNAFSHHSLARQRIHQLFGLIAWGGILGIHIVEDEQTEKSKDFKTQVEFLSDIVIRLDWRDDQYKYKFIEIKKSRCQRNVLGEHPFKIRLEKLNINSPKRIFSIYPSVHTQVSRVEKSGIRNQDKVDSIEFSSNQSLKDLIHKPSKSSEKKPDTGIKNDSFILLKGKQGGHKLAIGMNYLHGASKDESAIVINMGQPIHYSDVAGNDDWWAESVQSDCRQNLKWQHNEKVSIDVYYPKNRKKCKSWEKLVSDHTFHNPGFKSIFVLNFHTGFLLPEEFLYIVVEFIKYLERNTSDNPNKNSDRGKTKRKKTDPISEKSKTNNDGIKIGRILFNATSHLPERFPLLDRDPLILTALVRLLKQRQIALMIIGVEGVGREERIHGLSSMADLNVTVYDFTDKRLRVSLRHQLLQEKSGSRIISSDNITGKVYEKSYAILQIKDYQFDIKPIKA